MLSGSPCGGVTSAPSLAKTGLGCDPGLIGFGWGSRVVSVGNGNGIGLLGGTFTPVVLLGLEPVGLGASGILTGVVSVGCGFSFFFPPISSYIITWFSALFMLMVYFLRYVYLYK
jgi:hypothetical protein